MITATVDLQNTEKGTLYQAVERHMYSEILAGAWKPGERLESPDKIAEACGVSAGTLRQVLQSMASQGVLIRRPRIGTFINPELDLEQLKEPTAANSTTSQNSATSAEASGCVAMVVPNLQMYDFAEVAHGIERFAEEADLRLILASTDDDPKRLCQVVRRQIDAGVAGLIFAAGQHVHLDFDIVRDIQEQQIPVVLCFRQMGLAEWPLIRTDGVYNTHELAKHLCDIGRSRIAYFDYGQIPDSSAAFKRDGQIGFYSALLEQGVVPDLSLHLEYPWVDVPKGARHCSFTQDEIDPVKHWIEEHPQIDAILCVHDRLAVLAVQALKQAGRRIPEDVAVAGFGHLGHLYGLPGQWLTSMEVGFGEMGEAACDLIIKARRGTPVEPGTIIAMKGSLSVGGSTVDQSLSKNA